jgi:SAM-dependent methyltransferase
MDLEAFKQIRRAELEAFEPFMGTPPQRLLELGAGAGWQARMLAEHGYQVRAFDLASGPEARSSVYASAAEFAVESYDGTSLPLESASIDLVYSSHVLEHVDDLPALLAEIARVLKPQGYMLAVLPTPSWRLWNLLLHYPGVLIELKQAIAPVAPPLATKGAAESRPKALSCGLMGEKRSLRDLVLRALLPHRHGAQGSSLGELVLFSRRSWRRRFEASGWQVERVMPIGLFYTGYLFLGRRLSLLSRKRLAFILGSSSQLFVLRPAQAVPQPVAPNLGGSDV